ncbi:MAG: B12-binding domain-containing radical SAM protein [Acidobacteriota bacterium]|jgi:radical SAM superfamily enzyme YgiQ (UPF0313 family)
MGTKALLVYPEIPPTFWGMNYALPFIGKKASSPPLGLITVAAMLPGDYDLTLVDMNVTPLREEAVQKSDVVFCSSMIIQRRSFENVVELCRKYGKPLVAGGPYPTACHDRIGGVDHFVLNEAETTLPSFLEDFQKGSAGRLYSDSTRPDITQTPVPRFDLLDLKAYSAMALQFSRGCPHNCEFCDITELFGRYPRTKRPDQFVNEMDALYNTGFRGPLFVVDDNFIGNKKNVRALMPLAADWQKRHGYPFSLFTEATVSLGEDQALMDSMVNAGFNMVFLGIETPDKKTLELVHKQQNVRTDLFECVRRIQQSGLEVSSGFIVGFDSDPPDIFERQIRFIQEASIPSAMVGLLTAVPGSALHRRLAAEDRLTGEASGNNTFELRLNYVPKMDVEQLLDGYKAVISEIYRPKRYFERCLAYLKTLKPNRHYARRVRPKEVRAFFMSLSIQSFSRYGWRYWQFLIRAFLMKPRLLAESVTMAIKGHHFFKMTRRVLAVDDFRKRLDRLADTFREKAAAVHAADLEQKAAELAAYRDAVLARIRREYNKLHGDFRAYAEESLSRFEDMMDQLILSIRQGSPT